MRISNVPVGSKIICLVTVGGELSNNKGINRQGGGLSAPALTDKDRRDLLVAVALKVDYIAISFPRNADDVLEAITKFGIGEAFAKTIESLPGFEKGGETPDKPTLTIVGEKGKEYVMPTKQTTEYLPALKAMHEGTYDNYLNNYIDDSKFIPQKLPINDIKIQQLTSEMQAMRQSFEKNLPKVETYFDATTKELINIYKYHNKKKIIHHKLPRL